MEDDNTMRPRKRMRPRMLAGGSLGLVGIGVGITLALSAGGASAKPSRVVKHSDGSVQVNLDYVSGQNLPQVNQKLRQMGTGEGIEIFMASGAATKSGPVTCTPATGKGAPSGPTVSVLVGKNGTETIKQGQSAGNTAQGSFHLDHCVTFNADYTGNSGAG